MDVKTVFYLSRWEETSLVVTGAKGCVLSFLIFVSLCFPSFCLFSLSFSLSLSKQIQLISERFLLRFDSWKKIKFSFWEKIHLLFTFLCHCVFWSRPVCLSDCCIALILLNTLSSFLRSKNGDRIKGLKLRHFSTYCGAAPVHEVPQYTKFFFIPRVLRLMYCGSYEFVGRSPQYTRD